MTLFLFLYDEQIFSETVFILVDEFIFYDYTDLRVVISELEWFVHYLFGMD